MNMKDYYEWLQWVGSRIFIIYRSHLLAPLHAISLYNQFYTMVGGEYKSLRHWASLLHNLEKILGFYISNFTHWTQKLAYFLRVGASKALKSVFQVSILNISLAVSAWPDSKIPGDSRWSINAVCFFFIFFCPITQISNMSAQIEWLHWN